MKKAFLFIVFVIALISFSSCRSTSKSCGLAETESTNKIKTQQTHDVMSEFVS